MSTVGALVLAAGNSSRLGGRSKQLLKVGDQSLISRTINTILSANLPVHVVLGANHTLIQKEIEELPVEVHINPEWSNGMGSSIKIGLRSIQEKYDAYFLFVCDQPYLNASHISDVLEKHKDDPTKIIVSRYRTGFGIPLLFPKRYLSEFLRMSDEKGGKQVLQKLHSQLIKVPFPDGEIDIDTIDDYDNIKFGDLDHK